MNLTHVVVLEPLVPFVPPLLGVCLLHHLRRRRRHRRCSPKGEGGINTHNRQQNDGNTRAAGQHGAKAKRNKN